MLALRATSLMMLRAMPTSPTCRDITAAAQRNTTTLLKTEHDERAVCYPVFIIRAPSG